MNKVFIDPLKIKNIIKHDNDKRIEKARFYLKKSKYYKNNGDLKKARLYLKKAVDLRTEIILDAFSLIPKLDYDIAEKKALDLSILSREIDNMSSELSDNQYNSFSTEMIDFDDVVLSKKKR